MQSNGYSRIVLIILFMVSITISRVYAENTPRIAVVMSHNALPHKEVLSGFQSYFNEQGIQVNFDVYLVTDDVSQAEKTIQKIKKEEVSLIFTLGVASTEVAVNKIDDIPIVASLILRKAQLEKAKNVTGVTLEFPIETQFSLLKQVLPEARRIGVIYNPKENYEKITLAENVSKKMGLTLYAQEVNNPKDLPSALKSIAKNSDVLWGISDSLVLNPQTAKQILLFSFRNCIPFCGLTPSWVEAGALYSLCWDYRDIGMHCGEMALKILQGNKPRSLPIASPRKVTYVLNLKTAKEMKIKISEELINNAHQVFKE